MNSYVNNFIQSLKLKGKPKDLAGVLLTCKEDCHDFYIGYLGRNRHVIDDLLDYRESKLSIEDMSFDKFVDMCDNKVNKKVFENTFLQDISLSEVALIESMISSGRTSLKKIYDGFISNPNENILKNVL